MANEMPQKPDMYLASDLSLLNTYNYDEIKSPWSSKSAATYNDMVNLFESVNSDVLNYSLPENSVFLYRHDQLKALLNDPAGINRVYFPRGQYDLPVRIKDTIQFLVNQAKIRVTIVDVTLTVVATGGQFLGQLENAGDTDNRWHVVIASDNHDLYIEHQEMAQRRPGIKLVTPGTAAPITRKMTLEVSMQIAEESERYNKWFTAWANYIANCKAAGLTPEKCPVKSFRGDVVSHA